MKKYFVIIGLFFLAGLFEYAASLAETYKVASEIVITLSLLSYVCVGLGSIGILLIIVKLIPTIKSLIKEFSTDSKEVPIEEVKPIENAMDNLTTLLTQIRPNTEQADIKLQDAKMYSETLARLIIGLVDKAEGFEKEESLLAQALEAISTGEASKVKLCAGTIRDATIRQFLLSQHVLTRPTYQADVIGLISFEIGVLRNWQQGYDRFATSLFTQLSDIQGKLKSLEAGKEFMIAAKPILQIQTNLLEASNVLQLKTPGLRYIMKEALPEVSNHLLKG